ncbi:unnamed protein product [Caenorhabditis auriculariae]|uniref:Methyltransferase-like protein 13 n=1 Tax=Caenorhabditis auriculariae TaxID=2777116 RepID=A0A8S1GS36_9PELO|nr:unnamed protein product [Caenorhabditis auriculariae]
MAQGILHLPPISKHNQKARKFFSTHYLWRFRYATVLIVCVFFYITLYYYALYSPVILDNGFAGNVNNSLVDSKAGHNYMIIAHGCSPETDRCYSVVDQIVPENERKNEKALEEVVERHMVVDGFEETSDTIVRIYSPQGFKFSESDSRMWTIDHRSLRAQYIAALISAPFLVTALSLVETENQNKSVLEIGLGGGSFDMFIHEFYPQVSITAVELDPMVAKLANQWFGVKENDRRRTIVDDGMDFIRQSQKRGDSYDVVVIDACDVNMNVPCPVKEFRKPENLMAMKSILKENGALVFNLLTLEENVKEVNKQIVESICEPFSSCLRIALKAEVNEVIICMKYKVSDAGAQLSFYEQSFDTQGRIPQ